MFSRCFLLATAAAAVPPVLLAIRSSSSSSEDEDEDEDEEEEEEEEEEYSSLPFCWWSENDVAVNPAVVVENIVSEASSKECDRTV